MKNFTFTFESETLASLFIARLDLYLKLRATREGTRVVVLADEDKVGEIERLARGSYAHMSGVGK